MLAEAFAGWSDRDKATFARLSARFAEGMHAIVEGDR